MKFAFWILFRTSPDFIYIRPKNTVHQVTNEDNRNIGVQTRLLSGVQTVVGRGAAELGRRPAAPVAALERRPRAPVL